MTLWISNNGRICCEKPHCGGAYLVSAVAAPPRARTHSTPLDVWKLVGPALRAEFAAHGLTAQCETCKAAA